MSAADLIHKLNRKIRGWVNYHRQVVSKRTLVRVDHEIFSSLWRWARRRHPNKNTRWREQKYFASHRGRDWSFFGETCADEGQPSQVWLRHACSTLIRRHVKVGGDANPYDPAFEAYFEQREEAHMQETFRGTRTLHFLGMNSAGSALCAIQKSLGSRAGAFTIAFPARWVVHEAQKTACYFIRSAMAGFTTNVFLSRNPVSPKEAFEGLELCEGKLSCTILRGLDGSNPVRLLGQPLRMTG